ncbi:MAG: multidrug efflux SMR transporter [Candidatus Obscuribacterales bacterium]
MSWLILLFAGLLEIVWAVCLKVHDGRPVLIAAMVVSTLASVALLGVAMKQIPLGTAYAAWTGIGIVGTFVVAGFMGETVNPAKVAFAFLIITGILGLKLTG